MKNTIIHDEPKKNSRDLFFSEIKDIARHIKKVDEDTTTVEGAENGNYKLGQFADFQVGDFSLRRVLEKLNVREIPFGGEGDIPLDFSIENGVLGVSRFDFEQGEGAVYMIRPDCGPALAVTLHELGHIFRGDCSFENLHAFDIRDIIAPQFKEICCNMFSYYIQKHLGLTDELWFPVSLIEMQKGSPLFPDCREVEEMALKFIALGKS